MLVGYVILAAPHELVDVMELLEQVYHPEDSFSIHIDSKDPSKAAEMTKLIKQKYPDNNLLVRTILWSVYVV